MKPHAAPIDLRSYFVTELKLSANAAFNPAKPMELDTSDLMVEATLEPPKEGQNQWGVSLIIQQPVPAGKNVPYDFTVKIWGLFESSKKVAEDRRPQVILTTGSSMLYSAAREIVRDLTSRGPFSPLLLPSMSFFPRAETVQSTPDPSPSPT